MHWNTKSLACNCCRLIGFELHTYTSVGYTRDSSTLTSGETQAHIAAASEEKAKLHLSPKISRVRRGKEKTRRGSKFPWILGLASLSCLWIIQHIPLIVMTTTDSHSTHLKFRPDCFLFFISTA